MKALIIFLLVFFSVSISSVVAQLNTTVTNQQFATNYHSRINAPSKELKGSKNYLSWKKGMSKRKDKPILKGVIAGLVTGILIGGGINSLANNSCHVFSVPANLITGDETSCPSKVTKGVLIGGSLGLLIGLGVGQENAKKPPIIYQ